MGLFSRLFRFKREIEASQRKYEDLINTVDGIVWESNIGKSPYTLVSKQAEKILGYPMERWLTESGFWQRIVHPEDLPKLVGAAYLSPEQKAKRQAQYRLIASDGRVVWMKDLVTVIYENGKPVKMVGIMIDITDRKQAEAEYKEAQDRALKAASVKAEFLANMSHEIRTPLNAVIGMASLVLDTKLTRQQRDYLHTIKRSGDSLLMLINDILDFSKIEAGKLNLEIIDFNVKDLVKDAVEQIAFAAKKGGIRLETAIDPSVDPALKGDRGRILQVLANLLSNAAKFTEKGTITVSVSRQGMSTVFEVHDTGIGMPEETQSRLFTPFTQGDSSTARKFGGTGLGLSICKRLVALMGGEIEVRSVPGDGSSFKVILPLEKADATLVKRVDAPPTGRVVKSGLRRRVLVAEDNVANQKVILRFLEKLGYRAQAVGDGQEVLNALERQRYDLVLMDCQMPEMDGYAAASEIRHRERLLKLARIPILALTAHAMTGDREKCLEAGMDDYLSKPVEFEMLATALRKWTVRGSNLREVDADHFKELELLSVKGKSDLASELVSIFSHTVPSRISSLGAALTAKDFTKMSREAHALRSTCFSVGAKKMAAVCESIELLSAQGHVEDLAQRLEVLSLERKQVDEELAWILENRKTRQTRKVA